MKKSKRYIGVALFLTLGVVMALLGFGEAGFVADLFRAQNPAALYSVLRWLGVISLIIGFFNL